VVALFSSPYNALFLAIGMCDISSQGVLSHKVLSECSTGGVRFVSGNGRITIDNTLDERLRLLEEQVRYHHTVR
jgi:vacuolar-type H+-ATPase subunit E/Vma4